MTDSVAERRARMPAGTERFLDTRSLGGGAQRRLAELLRPGMSVLDVGCGTGAITEGIAEAVGPEGRVLGIDVSRELIDRARERRGRHPNLSFALADVTSLGRAGVTSLGGEERGFDMVTSARMLQWLADPLGALAAMVGAARPGGMVVALDYNHRRASWEPELPESAAEFYEAFLAWREQAGMDNEMADRLPEMFAELSLEDVRCTPHPEVTRRGEEDFAVRIALWGQVMATRGHQVVADGFLDEARRAAAQAEFEEWAAGEARSQTLCLATTEGVVPAS
ncbi:MAG TPA: methyltransferase domain-containing protein [Solirubrobacteraceae bacterium]|nr:methyltransferase domain-containing protein [Solirubrobacteraceae bacterium]